MRLINNLLLGLGLLLCYKTTDRTPGFGGFVNVCKPQVSFHKQVPLHCDHLCCIQTSRVLVESKWYSKIFFFNQNYMGTGIFKMGYNILRSFSFCILCVKYLTSSLNYLHW